MRSKGLPVLVSFALLLLACPATCGRRKSQNKVDVCVDMTRTMQEGMNRFPKLQAFLLNVTTRDDQDFKYHQTEVMSTSTHMGTHMDAPRHFNSNGLTIDQIPMESFNGVQAVVVDIRNSTLQDPGYQIQVDDLEDWESAQNASINNSTLVFLLTGWGERWADRKSFLGTDRDEPEELKFPGLSPLAATWLAQRGVLGVGTECLSVDPNGESSRTAHRTILNGPHSTYILENLANMDQLPPKGVKVRAFPMKIGGASGAPARVIACFRRRSPPSSSSPSAPSGRPSTRRSRKRHN